MDYEKKLASDLRKSEQIIQVVSAEDLLKEYQALKGNIKDYTVPVMDALVAAKLIREFGFSAEKVRIKEYKGRKYVIFKGYPGQREIFKGTRYLATNPKVVRMAIGPKGITESAKNGFAVAFVISVSLETLNYLLSDEETLAEFLGTVTADTVKIAIAAIAGSLAGILAGSVSIAAGVVSAPLVVAIAVGLATGAVLNILDRRYGVTKALINSYEKMGYRLKEIQYEFQRGMNTIEKNPSLISCLFGPCDHDMWPSY